MSNALTTSAGRVNGTPTRTKSPDAYCPGPTTSVFTGDEIGVMNAAMPPAPPP